MRLWNTFFWIGLNITLFNASFLPKLEIPQLPKKLILFQVQRLAEYERYLGQESSPTSPTTPENENGVGSNEVLQRGQLEGDLHRIQELFPGDNLRLHEREVLTTVIFHK